MEARDFYLRITNDKTGASHVTQHRVWDAERFMVSQQDQYAKEKGDAKATVTVASEDEYKASRKVST